MTQEEEVLEALAKLERMRKDVEALKKMDLESALQTGRQLRHRGPSAKILHGEVLVKVKDGLLRAGDGETVVSGPVMAAPASMLGPDLRLNRTTTPMRSKHQRSMLEKIWRYRNFKVCGTCGRFDTYKTRSIDDTRGVEIWCYGCGAQDEEVLQEYQPDPDRKHKQRECADCGKEIWATRGELMFPTGEKDPATGQPDYRCASCKQLLDAQKGGVVK